MGGSKKRKAAKKKKASEPNSILLQNNVVVENDELRIRDELEMRDDSPPVRSIASETEAGNGDNLDGTVENVALEIMEEVHTESNSMDVLKINMDYKSPGNEHESKTDEKLEVASESMFFEEAAAVEKNTEDSETMLSIPLKVEETTIDILNTSTPVVEQDEKPVPVSESTIARAIELVENTKELESPETSQQNQQPLVAPHDPQPVEEKTSWLGCCWIFDLLRGSR